MSHKEQVNLGSFYTPPHIVDLTYALLFKACGDIGDYTILEPSCGTGAFLTGAKGKKIVAADIDETALEIARGKFPSVSFFHSNALHDVSRQKYGIQDDEKLVIIGNPPYNDKTSQAKKSMKSGQIFQVDDDIKSRDIGLSSMLAYEKLHADYVAILHPLAYLIKKTNFTAVGKFMKNYKLREALVFNSQEFSNTSKLSAFPVAVAVYERNAVGTKYEDIWEWKFETLEGDVFSMSDFDYIGSYIDKYPNKAAQNTGEDILFYTMRDINALKRSRTFIGEDIPNAIHIDKADLDYYCYVDAFKWLVSKDLPYYYGNFDIPINNAGFDDVRSCFRKIALHRHPDILKGKIDDVALSIEYATDVAREYFAKLIKGVDR
ncbi:MAG: N-6 DNA methylase [Clostridiales Family XIII bacterium]|nr:N-6 DNA methylase [Clostridiales Family XIII bacterium]